MRVQTANEPTPFNFGLRSLGYTDVKWEAPNLRAPAETAGPVRRSGRAGWFVRRLAAFRIWRRNQQAITEFAMMSDRELRDIGLSRSDLSRVFDPAFNDELRQRGQQGEL